MTDRSPDDVLAKLRELDSAFERRGVPSDRSERIRRTLEQRVLEQRFAARLRWWPALAFAAGAAVMAAMLLHEPESPWTSETPVLAESGPTSVAPDPTGEELSAIEPMLACAPMQEGAAELAAGECVSADGVRLSAAIASRYTWTPDRVELLAGELSFDVEPRPEQPLEVVSGAATIEVIGTSFVVHHDEEGGWLSLIEGHVRVRVGDRAAVDLRAGQRIEWPRVDGPEREQATPSSRSNHASRSEDEGLAELLEEVADLRRRGEHQAAVDRLRTVDPIHWSPRAQQLVSYEIGSLLERQLHNSAAACEHWTHHRERFPNGRYDSIITRSMTRLGCADR